MKKYPLETAKETIQAIIGRAAEGTYDRREKFMAMLDKHPHIAAQGYNPYGHIFFWNEASALLYGYSESDAVNQNLFELILPEDMRTLARDMIGCAMKTGQLPAAGPCDLLRSDGSVISVYSGHIMFSWNDSSVPEFYCIDLAIDLAAEPEAKG